MNQKIMVIRGTTRLKSKLKSTNIPVIRNFRIDLKSLLKAYYTEVIRRQVQSNKHTTYRIVAYANHSKSL